MKAPATSLKPHARMYTSVSVYCALCREEGREADAAACEAEAGPGDIVAIENGEAKLIHVAVEGHEEEPTL